MLPSRREFLLTAGAVAAYLAMPRWVFAADDADHLQYKFVNKTNGKWTDDQCFWSLDGGKTWHSFAAEPTVASPGGGGRVYFCMGDKPKNFDDRAAYWDFIEWNYKVGGNWSGNTTQVDAFGLPLTIEMGDHKVGISESRPALFAQFLKDCPEPFRDCVKGDFWIVSPARAGFRKGGKHGDYFDKYVDEIWVCWAETPRSAGHSTGTLPPTRPTGAMSASFIRPSRATGTRSFCTSTRSITSATASVTTTPASRRRISVRRGRR